MAIYQHIRHPRITARLDERPVKVADLYQDAAESWPDAICPVQAQRALRGLIKPGTPPASGARPRSPPTSALR